MPEVKVPFKPYRKLVFLISFNVILAIAYFLLSRPFISSIYHGSRFELLNSVIVGQSYYPVEYYFKLIDSKFIFAMLILNGGVLLLSFIREFLPSLGKLLVKILLLSLIIFIVGESVARVAEVYMSKKTRVLE